MHENTAVECLTRVQAWLPTVPVGVYPSAELFAMFPGTPPARHIFGNALRACGARLCKSRGVRAVVIPESLVAVDVPPAGRPRKPAAARSVAVRLTGEQSAWVAAASRRQGNTEAAVIRFALAAAMAADGVR